MLTEGPPGQLNDRERGLLVAALENASTVPQVLIEVGTWLGGGSTLHILRTLGRLQTGHLWGIEADPAIAKEMMVNIGAVVPQEVERFTPLLGRSEDVLPWWLDQQGPDFQVDFVFLDGGNNPSEQVSEFSLLNPVIPVGGQVMAHDANLRKGRWLVPYVAVLDNWKLTLHDASPEGLLHAVKTSPNPSPASEARANSILDALRRDVLEIAARLVPTRVSGAIARALPAALRTKVFDGA